MWMIYTEWAEAKKGGANWDVGSDVHYNRNEFGAKADFGRAVEKFEKEGYEVAYWGADDASEVLGHEQSPYLDSDVLKRVLADNERIERYAVLKRDDGSQAIALLIWEEEEGY